VKPALLSLLFVLLVLPGCGGSAPEPVPTAAVPAGLPCAACVGSDTTGAVCDESLPLDTAATDTAAPQPASALPRLWEFGSEKCVPCITMKGVLEPLMTECAGKVDIRIVNVYEEESLARQFRIVTIPTQVFIDAAGNELFRHVGVYPRDSIAARFVEFGFPALAPAEANPPQPAASGN
jgi:thioredoxin 1